jgi:predicted kinase
VSAVHSAHPVNPAPPATALHGADATRRTYDRLALLAADVIDSGYPAIIDASFLDRTERARMRELARHRNAAFAIVDCTAPVDVLRRRVVARARAGNDPSDATAAVVEQQICTAEPLTDTERAACWTIDTNTEPGALSKRCEQLASDLARLGIA